MTDRNRIRIAAAALVAAVTATPAAAQSTDGGLWDPLETLNRATFTFNASVAVAVAPMVAAYRAAMPEAVQAGVDNLFSNLREPLTTVSSGLQGDFENAGVSAGRFAVNLVAGIGGILDVATPLGLVSRPADLGSALCAYGVEAGPYLVLPLVGPSTGRDAFGLLALYATSYELVGHPALGYYVADGAVSTLADAPAPAAASPDPYAEQRDAYLALREEICAGTAPAAGLKASPFGRIMRNPG